MEIIENLGLSWQSMLFYAINLIILFVAFKLLLFKPIKKIIDKRKEDFDAVYKENEKLNAEIAEQKQKFQQTLEETKHEVARMTQEAEEKIRIKEETLIKQAEAKAKAIIDNAMAEVEAEKKRMLNEYKEKLPELSVEIAAQILQREIGSKDNQEIISEALRDWSAE